MQLRAKLTMILAAFVLLATFGCGGSTQSSTEAGTAKTIPAGRIPGGGETAR